MDALKKILDIISGLTKGAVGKATAKTLMWIGFKQLLGWYQDYVEHNEDHLNITIDIEGKESMHLVISTARISSITNKINIPFIPEEGETITLEDINKIVISRVDVEEPA